MTDPVVELSEVAVELGGRPVLRGIDLRVDAGELVAVLGANGSGKSTLVRTTMGLVPRVRGSVRLFGEELGDFAAWRRIGFVPQRATAEAGVPATVAEVVAAGRLSRRRLLRPLSRHDRATIEDAIDAVGLADKARDGVATLSGGQQQRVLIARALAGEPELLVLDEPTAGVDTASQQAFADVLARLIGEGATVVLVAHELGPVAPLIDRTVVMRDGRVAYDGPAAPGEGDDGHHHHDAVRGPRDHVPAVAAPWDRPPDDEGRL